MTANRFSPTMSITVSSTNTLLIGRNIPKTSISERNHRESTVPAAEQPFQADLTLPLSLSITIILTIFAFFVVWSSKRFRKFINRISTLFKSNKGESSGCASFMGNELTTPNWLRDTVLVDMELGNSVLSNVPIQVITEDTSPSLARSTVHLLLTVHPSHESQRYSLHTLTVSTAEDDSIEETYLEEVSMSDRAPEPVTNASFLYCTPRGRELRRLMNRNMDSLDEVVAAIFRGTEEDTRDQCSLSEAMASKVPSAMASSNVDKTKVIVVHQE